MKKISLMLITALLIMNVLTPYTTSTAYASSSKAEQIVNSMDIMTTDLGDDHNGDDIVTRGEFAQMLLNLSGEVASEANITLYHDVTKTYWAVSYIQAAIENGWMFGYLNGTFKPKQGVTLLEAVYGVVSLLGYTKDDFSGNLSGGVMALYASKDLDTNISKSRNSYVTVDDCINLFYNTLQAETKDGKVYAETLGYKLNAEGELDYLSFVDKGTTGPLVAGDHWKDELPFTLSSGTFYKNDQACTYAKIEENDVLYYSEQLKTVWAYDDRVTGIVENISPNKISPKSATVAGKTYTFETSDVTIKFSTLGSVNVGDIVTVLLGKDGDIADVISTDELNTTITGIVLDVGNHLTETTDGAYLYTNYATFVDAAGNTYQQDYDSDYMTFSEGSLIRVTYIDGEAFVSRYQLSGINFDDNTFSSDGSTLGSVLLSSNVKILDYNEGAYRSIYPGRLAGVTLGRNSVCYYELNDQGELTQLILNNITGDMDGYGIFTGLSYTSTKTVYSYIMDGKEESMTMGSFSDYATDEGPIGCTYEDGSIVGTYELEAVKVISIGTTTIQASDAKYVLDSDCDVYYKQDGEYVRTTIKNVSDLTKYELTAYYDKPKSNGGRIRMIIAQSIK